MRTSSLFALPIALLAACSGGSGGGTGSTTIPEEGSLLLFDGASATDALVTSRLAVVTLERPDGSFVPNLLREQSSVTLADPDGGTAGFATADVPPGDYVALHLHFVPGSTRVTRPDGSPQDVALSNVHQRIELADARVAPGDRPWIVVGHSAPPSIDEPAGSGVRARWNARFDEPHMVRELAVHIVSKDADNRSAVGTLDALGDLLVELDFSETERFVWDDHEVDAEEFFERLEAGTTLRIDALLVGWRMLRVLAAERVEAAPERRDGERTDVLGTLIAVDPTAGEQGEVVVRVQIVSKGGRDLPTERPLDITARFGDHTKVELLRESRGRGEPAHGDIGDLEVGMFVKVHWHGPLDGHSVVAHRIEIRGLPDAREFHRWYEGTIDSLDAGATTFALELADASPVTVDVTGETVIVGRDAGGVLVLLQFGDLAVDDTVSVLGLKDAAGVVAADLVHVR